MNVKSVFQTLCALIQCAVMLIIFFACMFYIFQGVWQCLKFIIESINTLI
jgi:hypothetical protein